MKNCKYQQTGDFVCFGWKHCGEGALKSELCLFLRTQKKDKFFSF